MHPSFIESPLIGRRRHWQAAPHRQRAVVLVPDGARLVAYDLVQTTIHLLDVMDDALDLHEFEASSFLERDDHSPLVHQEN